MHRRQGSHFTLRPPDSVSINAAIAMRATFARNFPRMRAFFDELVEPLTRGGRKHFAPLPDQAGRDFAWRRLDAEAPAHFKVFRLDRIRVGRIEPGSVPVRVAELGEG